ncbi:unnamed protein product [Discosporangium mesarthrocarpum]
MDRQVFFEDKVSPKAVYACPLSTLRRGLAKVDPLPTIGTRPHEGQNAATGEIGSHALDPVHLPTYVACPWVFLLPSFFRNLDSEHDGDDERTNSRDRGGHL